MKMILDIDDDLRARIEARALTNKRTPEEEAVDMIWNGLVPLPDDPSLPAGQRIARACAGSGLWLDDQFQERIDAMWRDSKWTLPDLEHLLDEKDSAA
ncbi:MAG: hypothetical protein ACOVN0_07915 [Niveispirillum sp.]|uniref:hypothetical protein n=1 Tax=Niveispirillum sp. TaxID=1917217 RepID=UPI003BA522CB